MFALLEKRRRQKSVIAVAVEETLNNEPEDAKVSTHGLEDKPWDEVTYTLKQDLERVRTLAGSQERLPFKQHLVEKYASLVKKLLETHEDLGGLEVVFWWYQWQVDCGELASVYDDFRDAIFRGLDSPAKWSSNGHTTLCDTVFKYTDKAVKEGRDFDPRFLSEVVTYLMEGKLGTNAPLKVKLYRLAGDLLLVKGHKEQALAMFEMVMSIDPKKGGRKNAVRDLKQELGQNDANQDS